MSRGLSVYLDALRVLAALIVLLSHWAYPRFTDGVYIFIRELNLGSDAVVLFFVLSGLVIAYAAETKDRTARRFLFNRATRILSVAVPAVVVTFLVDRLGAALAPVAYDGWWYNAMSLPVTMWHALTFSNEWWDGVRIGTNGAYWSLSYEVAYYLMFAAAAFTVGWVRAALLLLLVFAVGPLVLLLLPTWLMGVAAWKLIVSGRAALPRGTALCAALAGPVLYAWALAVDMPGLLLRITEAVLGVDRAFSVLRFSDEFLWNWFVGLLAAVHIVGMAALLRQRQARAPSRLAVAVRWAAGASFSLYLVHLPVLMLVEAVTPDATPARHLLLLAATVGACLLFARLFERPLPAFRATLRRCAGLVRARLRVAPEGMPGPNRT